MSVPPPPTETPPPSPFEVQQPTAPLPNYKPPKKFPVKTVLIVAAVVIVLAVGGFVAMKVLGKKSTLQTPATNPNVTKVNPTTDDAPDEVNTETYTSDSMALQIQYPKSWKVTPATDGSFRLESADFTYDLANGNSVKGNFRIYVRMGARTVDSKYIGRGYAIEPSTKLTYAAPAPGQRQDTLISNFGYDEPNNFAYFMIAGNFQLNKGDTLGPNYAKEGDAFVIAGGYSSAENKEDLQMNEVPATSYKKTNAYKQALAILESIQVH